jgi:hypothetical protein
MVQIISYPLPHPRIAISDKAFIHNAECGKKNWLHQKSPGANEPGLGRILDYTQT